MCRAPDTPARRTRSQTSKARTAARVADEFGGTWGTAAIIVFSHAVTYGLYLALEGDTSPLPQSGEGLGAYADRVAAGLAGAAPTLAGLQLYGGFVLGTALLSAYCPGIPVRGRPLPSLGGQSLDYVCNGVAVWWATLAVLAAGQVTGVLPLAVWTGEHFGSILTWSVIFGDGIAVGLYAYCVFTNTAEGATGRPIYDVFMGVSLNPRIGRLDLKMWSELRVPWILLFVLTASCAAREAERFGRVSAPLAFMVLAHGLYANACAKGDHCVPTTWDIFHEKWGWMLIFWNFCGVPFTYCVSARWLLLYPDRAGGGAPLAHSTAYTVFCFALLLAAYYVFDTANAQKNEFRLRRAGSKIERKAFPQLPWGVLKKPKFLTTRNGGELLVDGWYGYARKPHYTADIVQALCWGLICGFSEFLPYWYVCFFTPMIIHRAVRDDTRCSAKYGDDWRVYTAMVPYVFVPGVV
mmetsp:Transcript_10365/g.31208  ORF Transcript_10365/g.31208 Transcript_10365/m.31208 type:complete len:465 (+) Transcript_10365:155-1549(+)